MTIVATGKAEELTGGYESMALSDAVIQVIDRLELAMQTRISGIVMVSEDGRRVQFYRQHPRQIKAVH